jgi:hypothetical protein
VDDPTPRVIELYRFPAINSVDFGRRIDEFLGA